MTDENTADAVEVDTADAEAPITTQTPDQNVVEDQGDSPEESDNPPAAEAARYRRRLRDVEAERDGLAARVEALQRSHIETLLSAERMTPAAFWAVTPDLPGLLADDGTPDPAKVKAAANTARDTLGLNRGLYVPAEGRTPPTGSSRQFSDAFAPPKNR